MKFLAKLWLLAHAAVEVMQTLKSLITSNESGNKFKNIPLLMCKSYEFIKIETYDNIKFKTKIEIKKLQK